ncbi:MAG: SDR family NAD(P)-dependent oxidoreductase, partial [Rubrivivax sp.]|nr:SDR family NAD(P)-dependent oxidoreductase [Rubrivivax sp.]
MNPGIAALFDLSGRRALVTGGSSGIGAAMARALGMAGAQLVLVARREAELSAAADELRAAGMDVRTLSADLTDPAAARDTAREAERGLGGIDILVNAAGVNLRQPFAEVSPDTWQS